MDEYKAKVMGEFGAVGGLYGEGEVGVAYTGSMAIWTRDLFDPEGERIVVEQVYIPAELYEAHQHRLTVGRELRARLRLVVADSSAVLVVTEMSS